MMFQPKNFYKDYLGLYHYQKVFALKKILEQQSKYEEEFYGNKLDEGPSADFKRMLKIEMRQTYFHCIETVFEMLFALDPTGIQNYTDELVLRRLSESGNHITYPRIKQIAESDEALKFLDVKMPFKNKNISVGHYLFYFNIFAAVDKTPEEVAEKITESIDAIKYGLRIIAGEFQDREEYNSYKHAMRVLPSFTEVGFVNWETKKMEMTLDLSDSISFFGKTKDGSRKILTKLFDTERDVIMTHFCSNILNQMLTFRYVTYFPNERKDKPILIGFFNKDEIDKCSKLNVQVQNLEFSWNVQPKSA